MVLTHKVVPPEIANDLESKRPTSENDVCSFKGEGRDCSGKRSDLNYVDSCWKNSDSVFFFTSPDVSLTKEKNMYFSYISQAQIHPQ